MKFQKRKEKKEMQEICILLTISTLQVISHVIDSASIVSPGKDVQEATPGEVVRGRVRLAPASGSATPLNLKTNRHLVPTFSYRGLLVSPLFYRMRLVPPFSYRGR